MAAKKKKKKKKAGKRGGAKKGYARSSSAKRGAAKRHTLKANTIVHKKPSKKSLRAHHMHAKKVKMASGKTAYQLVKNKKHKATARGGYAIAMRERNKAMKAARDAAKAQAAELRKKWRAVIALRARAEKLGLAAEMDENQKLADQLRKQIAAAEAERARKDRELEAAREESRRSAQSAPRDDAYAPD